MNLSTEISQELWLAVESAYEAGNYSHAILDAVHYLSSILRERAGVDGDGASLVTQALGGDSPRLRVNSLQTDTERNVQKGLEQIIRGVYLGIRNPRSHERTTDTKRTADSIIVFLDYLLALLIASREAFTAEHFMAQVLDPEFVDSARYAELLVGRIPPMRRGDAIIALYQSRYQVDLKKSRHLIEALLEGLSDAQLNSYLAVVSEELRTVTDDASIRTSLQMLTPEMWSRLDEVAKLRIENKLILGIRDGEVLSSGTVTQPLATWSGKFIKAFSLRRDAARVIANKLEGFDADDRNYVAKYFMHFLPEIFSDEPLMNRCIRAIVSAIQSDDTNVRTTLLGSIRNYPQDWQTNLAVAFKDQTDPEKPAIWLDDGTPFLSSPDQPELSDDDIPF